MSHVFRRTASFMVVIGMLFSLLGVLPLAAEGPALALSPINFTILHTNDFHGQLEPSGSNPGMARVAQVVNDVRSAVGADNVMLVDGGDEMQGSLLSNLQRGAPVIAVFNAMGYGAATFGNHEFDWGQPTLISRTGEAAYPYVSANIVAGSCDAGNWTPPAFAQPFVVKTVGAAGNQVKVAFIGVTTPETPIITIASATEGLCFKDPAASILHYYDTMQAEADVIVVLSHLGYTDGGYGYGIPVYGDQTLATRLNAAGKPVPLIIGGHSHTNLTAATMVGTTAVVQAHYNGRAVGRADFTFDPDTQAVTVSWQKLAVPTTGAKDPAVDALIQTYVNDATYQGLINLPIGYAQTDLLRNYNGDSMMGDFVDDAIYNALNGDAEPANDVDLFFNNAGGIRTDWCDAPDPGNPGSTIWSSNAADCSAGVWAHDPMLMTYGMMFTILPFGNATVVGKMTGAQILDVLNSSATLTKGAIQPAGMAFKFYNYTDALPGPQPWAWGAYDACVIDKVTQTCEALDPNKTYRVGTNEFLAPAGGDAYNGFKYMTDITYWGDMLNAVNAYVSATYTPANPYKGPNGDGTLDGRITRVGDATSGPVIPINILHHNDSHGNLYKGRYVGFTQLASLIRQEQQHNPTRTLLLNAGDSIQGDAMMYYFKTAPTGKGVDGTDLPGSLWTHPFIAVQNALNYTAMTLGNHEFNFGSDVFTSVLKQSSVPILQANLRDDGRYGIAEVPVEPFTTLVLPDGVHGDIRVAVLGIGNHRVPNYELPSNIPGLTFLDPIATAQSAATALKGVNDAVIAMTHIGFTGNPSSVEVDTRVDTNLAAQTTGIDAIIGAHSHTDPSKQTAYSGDYKYLPTFVGNPDGVPVIINQAYRYNNTLGEVVLGLLPKAAGGYRVASRAGRYISVTMDTPQDPAIKAIVDPYIDALTVYTTTVIGQTTAPLDALNAFTQETNGANLQADASVFELASHGIDVDFHLSGAMTNQKVASSATPADPTTLIVQDVFALMPYENSLLTMRMNGPQLKTVLERAYRNYYYYKYVPGRGGYSYYTTCMIDINQGGQITYNDQYPSLPDGNNVLSLAVDGSRIDLADATKFYTVSTVNYLAAGSCNFNDSGVSLWPLNQIVDDTQYYVRDAVIDYIKAQSGPISPAIEGRLRFANRGVAANPPAESLAGHPGTTLNYTFWVTNTGSMLDAFTIELGPHAWLTTAPDWIGLLAAGAGEEVSVAVTIPADAARDAADSVVITIALEGVPWKTATVTLTTTSVWYKLNMPLVWKH